LGLVVAAALIAMAYGVAHILGWQEYVCHVFATSTGPNIQVVTGLLYAMAYLGFVLTVPLFTLAAVILAILSRLFARTR
jgi:hypothetical protein